MYQYSLSWFVGHLTSAIDNTDKVDDVQQRIKDLKKYFTYFIYSKLCRSLQEKVCHIHDITEQSISSLFKIPFRIGENCVFYTACKKYKCRGKTYQQ